MIQENPATVQAVVFAHLDSLFKAIKVQEDHYLFLNEIISKVIHNRSEIEESIFIHDQINQYKKIIQEYKLKRNHFEQQRLVLLESHPRKVSLDQRVNMFLKRVCFRILEIIFASISQASHKAAHLYQKYLKLKLFCQKLISDNSQDKSYRLIKEITDFVANKLTCVINCIQTITQNLENGRLDEIEKLKDAENKSRSLQEKIEPSKTKQNKSSLESQRIKERPEKRMVAKEQTKTFDRVAAQKKGRKVMDSIKDVMEFNRHDFLEDFVSSCHEDKDKALKQLLSKNLSNKKQISQFIEKKSQKRKRRLSSGPIMKKEKHEKVHFLQSNHAEKGNHSSSQTTQKSLLLKFKEKQYQERTICSQYNRKINTLKESRFKLRSSCKKARVSSVIPTDREKKNAIIKAIEEIICQNQELQLKILPENVTQPQEKLPILNKRANSVDNNFKDTQNQQTRLISSKNLLDSIKGSATLVKKSRLERSDVFPSRMKAASNLLYQQMSNKLIHISDMNKQILF